VGTDLGELALSARAIGKAYLPANVVLRDVNLDLA
jgi:hypothetical protein